MKLKVRSRADDASSRDEDIVNFRICCNALRNHVSRFELGMFDILPRSVYLYRDVYRKNLIVRSSIPSRYSSSFFIRFDRQRGYNYYFRVIIQLPYVRTGYDSFGANHRTDIGNVNSDAFVTTNIRRTLGTRFSACEILLAISRKRLRYFRHPRAATEIPFYTFRASKVRFFSSGRRDVDLCPSKAGR